VRPDRNGRCLLAGLAGLAVAALLLALGAVMRSNANFSEEYVGRQLSQQRISFKPADALTPEEREAECLVRFAGQPLTSGEQAECYANHFIGRHLQSVAGGRTYAELRGVQTTLRAQIADAQARKDPAAADLQRQLAEVTTQRQTLFEGETVRGLLLTSFGFGTLGSKADQAATVSTVAGGAVLVLALVVVARSLRRRAAM
jgi:hypothetical protein